MYNIDDLMDVHEVVEYLNKAIGDNFKTDNTLELIREKEIPIVFKHEGWITWVFTHDGWNKSLNMQVDGYFKLNNNNEVMQLFKGELKEIILPKASVYHLNHCRIRNNASIPDGVQPASGDIITFKTGGRSPMFCDKKTPKFIKIKSDKLGVFKDEINNYLTKISPLYKEMQAELASAKADKESLKADNISLKQQLETLASQPQDIELAVNSQAKVAHLIYTLLSALKWDLTEKGAGNSNLVIIEASKRLGVPLSKGFIAQWLAKAYQLQIDHPTKKPNF